ncbi:hypothetical protein GT348_07905 [Aristophania vespae]|uniref:Glycosyltransferase n=1 Tax=Aristophania vespae TaxID=2697033 RepID=A0A6P1NMU1_9PROT|nr:hypothetical protein [Aristophania vespae]QHI96161.1 hypothetical protein GT348_07905 [Aristophania vespae]UMM63947.1 Alpha-1,6-glucosyltransferase [Aristophania vespae]
MARVIFLNCVPKTDSSEATKLIYQQAKLLREIGIDARVFQPAGMPSLLESYVTESVHTVEVSLNSSDVVIFPIHALEKLKPSLEANWPCKKLIYCHDPYLMVHHEINKALLEKWDILKVIVPNQWAMNFLKSVMGLEDVALITPFIDTELYVPQPKKLMAMCILERELTHDSSGLWFVILGIIKNKYPHYANIAWHDVEGKKQSEITELLGRSVVCVSLSHLDTTGLMGLRAMALNCAFIGLQGGGVSDYARSQNGAWHLTEALESFADSMAQALDGFVNQTSFYKRQISEGRKTVAFYNKDKIKKCLSKVYLPLLSK